MAVSRRALFILVLLLLAAYALRLFRLDSQSIWWDEGISLHLATSGFAEIVRDRLDNIHPPLYFFTLKAWLGLTGVSAFTGRYLSALAAMLQVPLVFAFTRDSLRRKQPDRNRLLDRPVAWIAGLLVVIFPLSIIYGQEIRVYAFLPLVFIALLWLGERLTEANTLELRRLVLLGLVAWLGLHLHYIAAFGVAYVAVWGVIAFARRGRPDLLLRWVGTFALVGLASLPWFVAMISNWSAVQAEASAGTFATDPVPLPFLFAQVWAFQLTGLAGALGTPLVRVLSGAAAVAFLSLIGLRIIRWDGRADVIDRRGEDITRQARLRLLAHWAIPLVLALVVWSLRSFSHPRYVTMFTVAFVPLLAALVWPARRWATQTAAALLLALVVFLNLWGLGRYFFNPDTAKSDMRGVAHYLETVAAPGDIILIPDTDWSLPFEYSGPATMVMATLDGSPVELPQSLHDALQCDPGAAPGEACETALTVYALDYARGTRDWQRRLPFELERRGSLLGTVTFDDLLLQRYVLDRAPDELPACAKVQPGPVAFGPLVLQDAWVEQGAAANSAVTVALCWQPAGPLTGPLSAAITLRDPLTGEQVGQSSLTLLDATGRTTTAWEPGRPVLTYQLVPLRPGTPPLAYDVSAAVFATVGNDISPVEIVGANGLSAGRETSLGEIGLSRPIPEVENPYNVAEPPRFATAESIAPGLLLEGVVVGGGEYRPGQTVRVGLLWRRGEGALDEARPELHLEQDGRTLAVNADAAAQGRYPAGQWAAGELVREVRDVRLPAGVDGPVDVVLQADGQRRVLGTIDVSGDGLLLSPPDVGQAVNISFGDVADLVGFTLADTSVSASDDLPVTLVWRSQVDGAATDYAVFVHLMDDDGVLIGQHDGMPDGGQRPTSDWLEGEYIVDLHPVTFRETNYTGPAEIRVGLYDPGTGTRLLTPDGADHIVLPIVIDVTPGP